MRLLVQSAEEKVAVKQLSIVFLGSGPVAAKSLSGLSKNFQIEAVITKSTTKEMMQKAAPPETPLYCVGNKAELDSLIDSQGFKSPLGVLIDFGIIVSEHAIASFEKRIINSHFSLLPALRGADPITFAILEGRVETGVSLMVLVEAMDKGPIIAQKVLKLDQTETNPELTEKLIQISDELLTQNLSSYVEGNIKPREQVGEPTYTRKLQKSDGIIDVTKPSIQLEREVRAYTGWPRSRTTVLGQDVIVTKAHVSEHEEDLSVACGDDKFLVIDRLLPAGKKEMTGAEFLRGYSKN